MTNVKLLNIAEEIYKQESINKPPKADELVIDSIHKTIIKARWNDVLRKLNLYNAYQRHRKEKNMYAFPPHYTDFLKFILSKECAWKFNKLFKYQDNRFTDYEIVTIVKGFYDLLLEAGHSSPKAQQELSVLADKLQYKECAERIKELNAKLIELP